VATITACHGHAGGHRSSNIPAPPSSTTPTYLHGEGRRRDVPRPVRRRTHRQTQGDGKRARGRKGERHNLLAEGSYSVGSEIKDGYPEFTLAVLKKLGWDKDLTAQEMEVIQRVNPANPDAVSWFARPFPAESSAWRSSMGCSPYGNAKARMIAWNLPDPIPVQREPIYTPRPGPGRRLSDLAGRQAVPRAQHRLLPCKKAAVDRGIAKQFPLILSSGRLVEYEGGGEETRSNKWLAELKQHMFVEINPADAVEAGHQGRRMGLGNRSGE